jgi:hypothetical protein
MAYGTLARDAFFCYASPGLKFSFQRPYQLVFNILFKFRYFYTRWRFGTHVLSPRDPRQAGARGVFHFFLSCINKTS